MSIVTVPEVKGALNISSAQYDSAVLPSYIEAAESLLSEWVGPLEPTVVAQRLDGPGLMLSTLPVLSLTAITSVIGESAIDLTGADVDPLSGVVSWSAQAGPLTRQAYAVEYIAGREEGALPAHLRQAVIELVRELVKTYGPGSTRPKVTSGVGRSNEMRVITQDYLASPPPVVAMLIATDRLPVFA